ncbi:hypothetical protein BDV93DRAFT_542791 [Ceratobasidium sp. AG-I]|nr:hypothetical protein BDV93DRAFT_542791 [Ceratobasidium sp. AG-I]
MSSTSRDSAERTSSTFHVSQNPMTAVSQAGYTDGTPLQTRQEVAGRSAYHPRESLENRQEHTFNEDPGSQVSYTGPNSSISGTPEVDHELAGLDALEDGRPGERPAYPFTTLIRYAIKGSPRKRLLLEDIYHAIQSRYPFFATAPAGWKNSVRHTLSLMTCFEKVARPLTEPGKGSYWKVNDSMPHAKPSRVRIRKRKAHADDDEVSLGTPMSVPDAFPPEVQVSGGPGGPEYHRRGSPFRWTEGSSRRHSSYVGDMEPHYTPCGARNQNHSRYGNSSQHLNNEDGHSSEFRARSHPIPESPPPNIYASHQTQGWSSSSSELRQDGAGPSVQFSHEQTEPVDGLDYRLVLMSELEKLRNVIGRREDIDKEWCRLMVERLKGTGLDF